MSQQLQTVRGMHDVLPDDAHKWHWFEGLVRQLVHSYGYREIRPPVLEKTELFARAIGEVTDIVEKEMFTFVDRDKDSLSLRPEFTASCVRSGIEHGFINQRPQRLWYCGPAFRHERPQKGRYRQFYQFGIEAFGFPDADIEAELLVLTQRLWRLLGIAEHVHLEINSLGLPEERRQYRQHLVSYFEQHAALLDEDSQRRLQSNPLRILDSKNPDMQAMIEAAPRLHEHLGAESLAHFQRLCQLLTSQGIAYRHNPRLVRGLDYYSHTVFEWVTTRLGSQGTVCAGGRYDGLVEQLGGKATAGIGFAAGVERLLLLAEELGQIPPAPDADVYVVCLGEAAFVAGLKLAEDLRDAIPGASVHLHCGGGSAKSQFKRADRSGAGWALVLGDSELEAGTVIVKALRTEAEQETVLMTDVFNHLARLIGGV